MSSSIGVVPEANASGMRAIRNSTENLPNSRAAPDIPIFLQNKASRPPYYETGFKALWYGCRFTLNAAKPQPTVVVRV